jgi:hypothetical protein
MNVCVYIYIYNVPGGKINILEGHSTSLVDLGKTIQMRRFAVKVFNFSFAGVRG